VARKKFIVRIDKDGSVRLPRTLLKELGVEAGTYAVIYREGSALVIRFKAKRSSLRLGRQVTTEEMELLIREALDELVAARWES